MTVSTTRMILASGSPRRKELLSALGYEFEIIAPDVDESPLSGEKPADHVQRLSAAKADQIAAQHREDLVIGADTIVKRHSAAAAKLTVTSAPTSASGRDPGILFCSRTRTC